MSGTLLYILIPSTGADGSKTEPSSSPGVFVNSNVSLTLTTPEPGADSIRSSLLLYVDISVPSICISDNSIRLE